jgi:uncharacterized protein (TIGR00255 family)
MPIQSMTGFGKGEVENESFIVSVEIKTVNNRFKDVRFKMSSIFNALEIPLKKKIESRFNRGSFEVFCLYKKNTENKSIVDLDKDKVAAFISDMQDVAKKSNVTMNFSPTDFLRSDFYVDDETKEEQLSSLLLAAFDKALDALEKSRIDEGLKLIEKLHEHKDTYTSFYKNIPPLKDTYQQAVRDKLNKRFENELKGTSIDEPRYLQEVIYYMEKLDIEEEITRIAVHLNKLDSVFKSNGEIGREIDFLVQELNRETNTIGSKSGSSEISENVVQMKVQLEKIREQALNLE